MNIKIKKLTIILIVVSFIISILSIVTSFRYNNNNNFVNFNFTFRHKPMINVVNYGAIGNGKTNDTYAIQKAIDDIHHKGGGIILIPNGIYLINATQSLNLLSNIELKMMPHAILQAIPNRSPSYAVINLDNVQHVMISGGIIKGERFKHKGTSGEWGMGIRVNGVKNVIIKNTFIEDCWGDGIYLGANGTLCDQNVKLLNVLALNNRRNGISLISGNNVLMEDCSILNSGGTAPGDGIDIEPNYPYNKLENIRLYHIKTFSNAGNGIEISLGMMNFSHHTVGIKVIGHIDKGSKHGFSVTNTDVSGSIVVTDYAWMKSKSTPFIMRVSSHSLDKLYSPLHVMVQLLNIKSQANVS